jgi:hypothetical protein
MREIEKRCEGYCPICGSDDLDYYNTEIEDCWVRYEFTCNACKNDAIEWYRMQYDATTTMQDDEDER